ncbi:MAG: acyl-ACP--UDP-N-acetylglucosamine O-acyltransferase [Synoicihabitans sp.]
MPTQIHPQAIVDPAAELGVDVEIGPFAVVTKWARLGDGVVVHPGAVIGGDPQYLGFDAARSTHVEVGARTVLRESVTINRSMYEGKSTVIGADCFFMACSHAGHDCEVADGVVLANNAMLAGHVTVGAKTFVGGGAGIHQFCRIGEGAMIAGLARITKDVAPFCMSAERDELTGLNLVGLKRREWPREIILEIKEAYRDVFGEAGNPKPRAAALLAQANSDPARTFLAFFEKCQRPIARPQPPDTR